jgi:predicted membrane-bound dolichyl-phosphate-mannose-protein mannosyltransferase
MYLLAVVAGIMEFVVVGILFLMAGFSITGYAIFSRIAATGYAKDPASRAQLILGILAVFGFLIGLAASVSAVERRRWALGITGALTTAFWGVLLCFYTLLALKDPVDVNFGMTIGSIVILFSALSGLLLIASRHEFQKRPIDTNT